VYQTGAANAISKIASDRDDPTTRQRRRRVRRSTIFWRQIISKWNIAETKRMCRIREMFIVSVSFPLYWPSHAKCIFGKFRTDSSQPTVVVGCCGSVFFYSLIFSLSPFRFSMLAVTTSFHSNKFIFYYCIRRLNFLYE